eukprot:scaffold25833_cov30-Prasinocladus_malaysianus.AAC.1
MICWVCCSARGFHVELPEGPSEQPVVARVPPEHAPRKDSVKHRFSFCSKSGNEGLRRHVLNQHPQLLDGLEKKVDEEAQAEEPSSVDRGSAGANKRPRATPAAAAAVKAPATSFRQAVISKGKQQDYSVNLLLALTAIRCNLDLSVVDDPCFRLFAGSLNP